MPRKPADRARRAAFDVLRAVEERDAFANLLLPSLLTERGITGRDAAFATELTYGTLRGLGSYDEVIDACSDRDRIDPRVRDVLRLGAHQLLGMGTGGYAAVATSVDLIKRVAGPRPSGFVNAVLRRVATRDLDGWAEILAPDRSADEDGYLAMRHSYPRWIVTAFRDVLADPGQLEQALAAGNDRPEVTLAVLPPAGRSPGDGLVRGGARLPRGTVPARWSPFGVRLAAGGDPAVLVASGRAAVQDEASQLVALALSRVPVTGHSLAGGTETVPGSCPGPASSPGSHTDTWLDLCAGPGGKARLLAYLAGNPAPGAGRQGPDAGERRGSGEPSRPGEPRSSGEQVRPARLVAAEFRPHRALRVRGVLARSGATVAGGGAVAIAADGRRGSWRPGSFIRVLADVPCTGLGALRRRPEARWRKTPGDLPGLTGLQRELLAAAIDATRPGGVTAYVTCSPHRAETSEVIRAVTDGRDDVEILDAPSALPEVPGLAVPADPRFAQFWPHQHGTDAMFLALLRRVR